MRTCTRVLALVVFLTAAGCGDTTPVNSTPPPKPGPGALNGGSPNPGGAPSGVSAPPAPGMPK